MSVIALLILLGHVVVGLPAQNDIRNCYRAMAKQDKGGWGMLLDTHLTVWFWLAFLLLLGAIGILVSETGNRLGRWRIAFRNLDMPDESASESVFPDLPEAGGRRQPGMDDAPAATYANWIDTDHTPAKTPLGTKIAVIAVSIGTLAVVAVAIMVSIKIKKQDQQKDEIKANKGIGPIKGETVRVTLTEDQLAAWRKVRKEHIERPVRVLGCLPRFHGRQAFDDDWRAEDCWHFAHQDRIFIEGTRVGQSAPPWAKDFDLGDAYFPATFSVKFEDTEEYRNLLETKRKEDAKRKEDRFYPIIPNWFEDSVKSGTNLWEAQKFPAALRYAEQFCQRKEAKATVVIDIFGGESPRILRWYWNDGKQTLASEKPPNQQRKDSLQRFLQAVMRNADSID